MPSAMSRPSVRVLYRWTLVASLLTGGLTSACGGQTGASGAGRGSSPDASPLDAAPSDGSLTPEDAPVGYDAGTSSGGDDAADGPACPEDLPFKPRTYPPVTVHPGACTSGNVAGFLEACGDEGNITACQAWIQANTPGENGEGTACGNCILPADNTGAAFLTFNEYFFPNYGACVELLDPTGGAHCAQPLDALTDCDAVECEDCTALLPYPQCVGIANGAGGFCGSFAQDVQSECSADLANGGVVDRCQPGAASGELDPDWEVVIGLVCVGGDAG
jgi:hypothetical protein